MRTKKKLTKKKNVRETPQRVNGPVATPSRDPRPGPNSVVGIGASAGGLEAFEQFLGALPKDTGMAFVLVQHLAPRHNSLLSELLARFTKMKVVEVTQGMAVEPDHVYVIPPNADMTIMDCVLHLSPQSPERARRMPIDQFFRSLAEDQQSQAIGVVLSGSASDGTLGLQAIKAMGGVTFAQDDKTAKFSGMPHSAIASGIVDFVLPPNQIAQELQRISSNLHLFARDDQHGRTDQRPTDEALNSVYRLLRDHSRVDFSSYKPGTIKRRISRRMVLRKADSLQEYLRVLRKYPDEVEALFNDLLINVTAFFRDSEAFDALREYAFPALLRHKSERSGIRIWVPGCSTGEEAYSLAIAMLEFLGDQSNHFGVQVFATDLSEAIIQKARSGIYPESIAMDLSPDRLRRFFRKVDGGYQISKSIRDMCIFAKQDVAKDPPFSKIDMISCRNVMIYMSPLLQKRIVPLFHYALNPGGILFLGSSETTGAFGDLFAPLDKKNKIYSKKGTAASPHLDFVPYRGDGDGKTSKDVALTRSDIHKAVDQVLLSRYVPPSVVVDEKLDIVQFVGQTGIFLEHAPGDASLNLINMIKTGLHKELRTAFQKAKRGLPVRREGLLIESKEGFKSVNLEIVPVADGSPDASRYLVVFEEDHRSQTPVSTEEKTKSKSGSPVKKVKVTANGRENARLKEELEATREYLQSIIEEQRTTNEELRSANEEIQSSNEELQSINEELETAKEELQSTNEELTTVNEELQNRNDELSQLNSDLNNLLSSVNIPIVMLGNDLRIRRFTPVAGQVLNLIPTDAGRPFTDIKPNLRLPDMRQLMTEVIHTLETKEQQVEDNNGKWYSMRVRPYRTLDNKIDGVVIILLGGDANATVKSV